MGAVSAKLRRWEGNGEAGYVYWCQGCEHLHSVRTEGPDPWGFNGNTESPTFTPSVLTTFPANPRAMEEYKEWRTERRCHTFITDGIVQFLGDCTHALAGQTHPLPDLPADYLK